ncbi:hypothetical protein F2Q69_00018764 [Brassica cretica]|uniref:ELP1 alpha-solenoid domain-containing protein n=1 Tax=Brassica cretica TaxID=69181 RepID=A0A8S9QMK9_BRACR|nr:hypothetical protein F2Q69_00018764 [Brassica cretica]
MNPRLFDNEAVFEAALGLFDLNLAAIAALNSHSDPKEFIPYLQELERMPEPLMHFNIDIELQRFDSALKNIVSAGDGYFPDCMNLMKKKPSDFPAGSSANHYKYVLLNSAVPQYEKKKLWLMTAKYFLN